MYKILIVKRVHVINDAIDKTKKKNEFKITI